MDDEPLTEMLPNSEIYFEWVSHFDKAHINGIESKMAIEISRNGFPKSGGPGWASARPEHPHYEETKRKL